MSPNGALLFVGTRGAFLLFLSFFSFFFLWGKPNQKHTLMEATGPISTTKRPRVGRNHHDILRAIEVDVECSNVSRNTRKLLTTQFTHTHKPLGDILASAASELDALFKSEPSTVVAVVIEA